MHNLWAFDGLGIPTIAVVCQKQFVMIYIVDASPWARPREKVRFNKKVEKVGQKGISQGLTGFFFHLNTFEKLLRNKYMSIASFPAGLLK